KATKGVAHLAQLLGHPGREFHARDLAGSSEFAAGDAGEVLDAEARRVYRDRLRELGEELAAAQGREDDERADALVAEMESLERESGRGPGFGGRSRRAASDAERARLNVTRSIGRVVRKIADDCPVLGQHLSTAVKTGIFCSYEPDPAFPLTWDV